MRLCKLALVFGVVALLASPVLAQPGGGRGGMGGPGQLLRIEKVQKDLGLDKDAVTKVEDAIKKVQEDNKDDVAKLRDRDTKPEERAEIAKKLNTAYEKGLKDVLTEKQQKRLKQIQRQIAGFAIFQDEEVQKTLKLSDEQKDKVKEINKDLDKEMADLRGGGFSAETFAKMATLRKDAMTNAMKVLTDDQKKQMKDMTGEPLELTPQDLFPGRGGKPAKPRTDF
jgi:hypothetical protein